MYQAPFLCQPRRPTWLAADAAGAPRELAVFYRAVSCRRSSRSTRLPAAPLKPSVGRSLNPNAPGHARGMLAAPRRGCRIAPRERGALMRGCGGRAPSGAARGGRNSVRLPYSPRVPPACAVGARPPPRYPRRRPTALAADTAGAASNLGVFYPRVMCRCAPRSINPASGAAEAGRWAAYQTRPHPKAARLRSPWCPASFPRCGAQPVSAVAGHRPDQCRRMRVHPSPGTGPDQRRRVR